MLRHGEAAPDWIDYWDSESLFGPLMRRATAHFHAAARDLLAVRGGDVVLDFGCGPGYLSELLALEAGEVHGVDTSAHAIAECRARCGARANLHFHHLDRGDPVDLSFLGGRRFSLIICLSVIQYFDSLASVERLLRSFARVAAPGGRALVADIPVRSSPIADTGELLRASISERFLGPALQFLVRSAVSPYARTRSRRGLLTVSEAQLRSLLATVQLDAEILATPLTWNRQRLHVCVRFPPRSKEGSC
jgi:SAM-dependent methyltransferase